MHRRALQPRCGLPRTSDWEHQDNGLDTSPLCHLSHTDSLAVLVPGGQGDSHRPILHGSDGRRTSDRVSRVVHHQRGENFGHGNHQCHQDGVPVHWSNGDRVLCGQGMDLDQLLGCRVHEGDV